VTATDPDLPYRIAALEASIARLESLLGGSTKMIEEVRFSEGAAVAAGQGLHLTPGAVPDVGEGGLYFDSTLHKLEVRGESGWETVHSGTELYGLDNTVVANLANTTAEAEIKSVTVAMPGTGLLLIWFHCNPYGAAGKYTRFRLKIGGTTKRSDTYSQWPSGWGGRQHVGFVWAEMASGAGDKTVTVTAQNNDSTYTTVFNDCTLMVVGLVT
jgi:hypothetical protein